MPKHVLGQVPGKHVPVRQVFEHVLKYAPRHVLKNVTDRHMPQHMSGHVLEHVPQIRHPDP